jgi:hypothetical protein
MYLVSKYVAFFNAAVAISLLVGKAFTIDLPTWYFVVLSGTATVVALFDKLSRDYKERDIAQKVIKQLLSIFLDQMGRDKIIEFNLRVNLVGKVKSSLLSTVCHVNMDSDPMSQIVWMPNQGHIGVCYEKRGALWADLTKYRRHSYDELRELSPQN